jgi:hypothetical protein
VGERISLVAKIDNQLALGRYYIHCGVTGPSGLSVFIERALSFVVFGSQHSRGLLVPDHKIEVELEGPDR